MVRSILAALLVGTVATAAFADPLADGVSALTAKDYAGAMRILLPLANGGNDEAQRIVGEMIFQAQGVPANPAAAFAWTKLAAENGNAIGQYNLGYLYETGSGVPRSMDQAVTWYTKSARRNYMLAQRRLGEYYAATSLEQSTYWYNLARLNGDDVSLKHYSAGARQLRDESAARMAAERAERYERERADYEETRRMQEAARPTGNYIAQGIAEGLANVQRDSAGVAMVHARNMANIQSQQADRLRAGRDEQARQDARDERERQAAAAEQRRSTAASSSSSGAAAQAGKFPLTSYVYRAKFVDGSFAQTEAEARDQATKARQRREGQFDNAVAKYRAGKFGYESWRAIKVEPMACADEAKSGASKPWWRCGQRVDYQIVSTDSTGMGDEVYTENY